MTHAGGHLSYLRDDRTSTERGPVRRNRCLPGVWRGPSLSVRTFPYAPPAARSRQPCA